MDKHSYMDDKEKNPDPKPVEPGTTRKDQQNVPRTDPGLKKGYNEKNPGEPQGSFTPQAQTDEPAAGDETKE